MRFKQLALTRSAVIVVGMSLLCTACGEDTPNEQDPVNCQLEDRDDTYVAGLEKVGETGVKIMLMESIPAPPSKGDNTWLLDVYDSTDAPLTGLTVTVTPFMPDHGHGTPIVPEVVEQATEGEYQVAPVNLWMPGLWETTIEVTDGGAITDEAVFSFCIEG